jgi:RHH-type proline utilization regulon transcriptional repressor/proline dehydrogenase/delta 1-pyrroline-5-carboxylate dehydrogenase
MFKASQLAQSGYILPSLQELDTIISANFMVDENAYINELIQLVDTSDSTLTSLEKKATQLVGRTREIAGSGDSIDAFLQTYSLDTDEGVILMCLAETLLRIPDAATADALIKDKLAGADWQKHLKSSDSMLVNASTWGLMLTGKVYQFDHKEGQSRVGLLDRMVNRLGEPVVRKAMYTAMKIMGKQFVLGRNIDEALKESRKQRKQGYTHSYDMLGEAALTESDANAYFEAYAKGIVHTGKEKIDGNFPSRPTISVKLSALHPRYEVSQQDRVISELYARVEKLITLAREHQVGISIDAEEADRLELSLTLFKALSESEAARGWGGLGFVVQAYSKRALPVLMWLNQLAKSNGDEVPVRLVKGAYWDTEIKLSQQLGLAGYPVFTRKACTDISYLACAHFMLSEHTTGCLFPQFATHNAQTLVTIQHIAGDRNMEFQRLHGMGEELYGAVISQKADSHVRVYAPVGSHKDLLPYLVRRLLENGANSSFVHKLVDPNTPVDSLVAHPAQAFVDKSSFANERIPLPSAIFSKRTNSRGIDLNIKSLYTPFLQGIMGNTSRHWQGGSIIDGQTILNGPAIKVSSPQNVEHHVGNIHWANNELAQQAITVAVEGFRPWNETSVEERGALLEKLADSLEDHQHELISLCTLEAGKSLQDGIDEVREAVDFCRYYAVQGRAMFAQNGDLEGPTGERNQWQVMGKGVFVCISPWNFPLAIFLGQISAALMTGNTVIAKPAEQTGLIAYRTVELMLEVGFPADAIQLLPGKGKDIGAFLTQHASVVGVCFTGSTQTAKQINMSLAQKSGPIATFIAETGGQNAMLLDSTSLPEQVIKDAVASAFTSAGQRCSALRVMYVQEDVAQRVIQLLQGAMDELVVGDPIHYKTDVGPVIDQTAKDGLNAHIEAISQQGKLIAQSPLPIETRNGYFVAPTAIKIDSIEQLSKEHFGPILHVVTYQAKDIDKVIRSINNTGYGLTLGIHSRNESFSKFVAQRVNVGNVYINRNQVGAVVGVQPFGGQGLSGTGPKAGGPHYLTRFVTEKTISDNITAIGGNATLLTLDG